MNFPIIFNNEQDELQDIVDHPAEYHKVEGEIELEQNPALIVIENEDEENNEEDPIIKHQFTYNESLCMINKYAEFSSLRQTIQSVLHQEKEK